MARIYLHIAFLIILLGVSSRMLAQQLTFDKITDRSGRSLGFTSGVLQGDSDYLWVATSKGLIRYNGYAYKQFRHSPNSSSSIASSTVSGIFQDSHSRIWLKHLDYFSIFNPEAADSVFQEISEITFDINASLIEDHLGNLWIGPHKKGILKIDSAGTQTWFQYQPPRFTLNAENILIGLIDSAQWKIDREKTFADTSISFTIKESVSASISGCGELYNGELFDYTYLCKGKDTVWRFLPSHARFLQGKVSTAIHSSIIELTPGSYQLHCYSDDSDIEKNQNHREQLPSEGIYITTLQNSIKRSIADEINKSAISDYALNNKQSLGLALSPTGEAVVVSPMGVEIYSQEKQAFVMHHCPFTQMLNTHNVEHVATATDEQALYIGTNVGLIKYSFETASADTVFTSQNSIHFSGSIYSLCADNDILWIGTRNGLNAYDKKRNASDIYLANTVSNLWGSSIFGITKDKSGNIWVSTAKGLNRLRRNNFKHAQIASSKYSKFPYIKSGGNEIVYHAYKNYLCRLNAITGEEQFISLDESIFPYNPLFEETEYSVQSIATNDFGKSYIGIGNMVIEASSANFKVLRRYELRGVKYGIDSIKNQCREIFIGAKGQAWAVSADGIERFGSNDKFRIGPPYNKSNPVDFKYIISSFLDSKQNIWIRTKDSVMQFSTVSHRFENKWVIDDGSLDGYAYKGDFAEDRSGNIWLSAMPLILQYSHKTGELSRILLNCKTDVGTSNVYAADHLWIYTDNGLLKLDPESFEYQIFGVDQGLADNNISGVLEDKYGKLWITTLKGLSVMQIEDHSCESYYLPSDNEHYNFSGTNISLGSDSSQIFLLFTNKGYLKAETSAINLRKPRISIEGLTIKGSPFPLDSLKALNYALELPHNQNFISIEFAALDYSAPAKNKYEYKLVGLDTDWQKRDASSRTAIYTGLAPGNYTFQLRGCNNDYIWNNASFELTISINPPWWRTWGAYISYILLIGLSLFGYIKARERQLQAEKLVLEQKVTERTFEIRQKQKEITKQRDEIAEHQKSIMDSIHYASRIQQAVLPPEELTQKIMPEHFILSKPRDIVSGDYYWIYGTDKQTIFAAADCTGHGVPGAFMSMLGIAFLNEIAGDSKEFSANEVLNKLRQQVIRSLHQTGKIGEAKDGMDIAICVLDNETNLLQFAGAYNPLYLVRDGELTQLKADRMPIGYHMKVDVNFSNSDIQLIEGDCIYIFSDGYADQFGGENGKKFMAKRFKQLLQDINHLPMPEQQTVLDDTIEAWRGKHEQVDDILVIGVRIGMQKTLTS